MPFPALSTLIAEGTIASTDAPCVTATRDALAAYELCKGIPGIDLALAPLGLPTESPPPAMDFLGGDTSSPPPPPRVSLAAFVAGDEAALAWIRSRRAASREGAVASAHLFSELTARSAIMRDQRQEWAALDSGMSRVLRADHHKLEVLALEATEARGRTHIVANEYGGFVTWVYDCLPQWHAAAVARQQQRLDAVAAVRREEERKLREAELAAQKVREAEAARAQALKLFADQKERAAQRAVELQRLQEEEERLSREVAAREAQDSARKAAEAAEKQRLEREAQLAALQAEEAAIERRRLEARDRQLAEALQEEEEILKRLEDRESQRRAAAEARQRQIEELRQAEAAEAARQQQEAERRRVEALTRAREEEAALARRVAEREEREAAMKRAEHERAQQIHEQKLRTLRLQEEAAQRRLDLARDAEFQRLVDEDAAYAARGMPSAAAPSPAQGFHQQAAPSHPVHAYPAHPSSQQGWAPQQQHPHHRDPAAGGWAQAPPPHQAPVAPHHHYQHHSQHQHQQHHHQYAAPASGWPAGGHAPQPPQHSHVPVAQGPYAASQYSQSHQYAGSPQYR